MKLRLALLAALAFCLPALPALAQNDIFDNGPTNGTVDAWTINFGFAVSDQVTLRSASQLDGLQFAVWLFPGDVIESVEMSITDYEGGGSSYFDQQLNVTESGCALNQLGFNVCNANVSFAPLSLNAGSYWLNLQNAVVNTGDPVYWDENDGPAQASEGSSGTIPSESFTVIGSASTTTTTGTTPEPGTLTLLASGAFGLIGFLRRRPGSQEKP